jgi:PIN domain nuclease of toxin-antitoxin system
VKLLLDTHSLLWALEDSPRLSSTARLAIVDPENEVLASAASAWEIAIKVGRGKLKVRADLDALIVAAGFIKRAIAFPDARRAGALPHHHGDPFDRILVAQALEDGVPIVTCDPQIQRYGVQILW